LRRRRNPDREKRASGYKVGANRRSRPKRLERKPRLSIVNAGGKVQSNKLNKYHSIMRINRSLLAMSFITILLLPCCTQKDKTSSMEMLNKSVVIKWLKEINKDNFELLFDELWTPDCKQYFNSSKVPLEYDDFKKMIFNMYEEYPVISHEIHDIIAKDDMVIARFSARVTHDRLMFGAPASGKELYWSAIAIFQLEDGKIKNRWEMTDLLGMYQQLGMELKLPEEE